ncbi:MAG: glutathione S-transferase family protein, partial [Alphaproteobacteria bacterium]
LAGLVGKLAPKVGTKRRADWYRWSAFVGDTVKEAVFRFFRIGREEKNAKVRKQKQEVARKQLDDLWQAVDRHLSAGGPYLLGKSVTTPDFHLHLMELWDPDPKRLAATFRHVGKHMERMAARPAVKRVVAQHAKERAELQATA